MSEPDELDARARTPAPWTVSQLTQRLRGMCESLGRVSVEGEVASVKIPASGHLYFDLKDIDAKVSCSIWRSVIASALRFQLREGERVVVHGKLDVYAPRGTYSLQATRVERAGAGALLAQLEKWKQELKARGWFDRKRPVPAMPRTIGVVTSRDGAAFQDFLRTRSLRWPLYPVRLVHTPVQGTGAAAQIAAAIARCDASGADVIVVIRGGGSLEDLWAFNELAVAEAIWATRAPVVSGVGHETDVTLCDLVADVRAHTPTDAAQRVIPDRRALVEALELACNHLLEAMSSALEDRGERLERAATSRVLRDPRWILDERREWLGKLGSTLAVAVRHVAERANSRLADARRRLERRSPAQQLASRLRRTEVAHAKLAAAAAKRLGNSARDLETKSGRLEALSPLAVLGRGYSITTLRGSRAPLRGTEIVAGGAELETRLANGSLVSRVSEVRGQDGR